jgi:hypothetical protein
MFDTVLELFPKTSPDYVTIKDDPIFNPAIHLSLELPTSAYRLQDFGYNDSILASVPTEIAATSCFRVLSDEGVAALYHVCKQLEAFTTSNPRISRNVRGGVYRSKFLRDMCLDPNIAEHLSAIMQTPLLPIAMPHQLGHINFQPLTIGENVDKWHYDTLLVDTVMFVTDPNTMQGGEFQYFLGSRDEMAVLRYNQRTIPTERIIAPDMPGAGYAVLMQGNYVVHQAKAVQDASERITLVNGYSYGDLSTPDYSAIGQLMHADAPKTVTAEYVRHIGLRVARQLQSAIQTPDFQKAPAQHVEFLRQVRDQLDSAIEQLTQAEGEKMRHFGD